MKIISVEPTPSPNSMKLTLDSRLNPGVRLDYRKGAEENAPGHIKKLLSIPGVTGVFQTADFLALERHPKGDWESILAAAEGVLGVAGRVGHGSSPTGSAGAGPVGKAGIQASTAISGEPEKGFGEVTVLVQTFRGIPMQVRVSARLTEKRAALPERFQKAAAVAGLASPNLIMERKLEDRGVRYGELEEVLQEVVNELEASFDDERLEQLVERSREMGGLASAEAASGTVAEKKPSEAPAAGLRPEEALDSADWRVRYAALERLEPSEEALPLLIRALGDPHISVKRLAVVYIGDVKAAGTLELLIEALQDPSPIIRRTAGDTLSDRGDPAAVPAMERALADPNKLVRWRAARFLYETGGESSVPALEAAKDDPEFEIRLQIKLALERIRGGEDAQGTVWQQMTRRMGQQAE